jgi:hypothetical protein
LRGIYAGIKSGKSGIGGFEARNRTDAIGHRTVGIAKKSGIDAIEGEHLPARRKAIALAQRDSCSAGRGRDRLTDAACRAFKPKPRPYKKSDGLGLYLLVKPSGAKLWQWPYTRAGKANVYNIGAFPDVGVAEARDERDKACASGCARDSIQT